MTVPKYDIRPQASEAYFLRFIREQDGKLIGECFGWCVCVITPTGVNFHGDYGNYTMTNIYPQTIESIKSWIISTAAGGNLDYVMSKTDTKKVLVNAETLEKNFWESVKDNEIDLDDEEKESVKDALSTYDEWPDQRNAHDLYDIAFDDAGEFFDDWHDWSVQVKAFFNEQYQAFADYFKKSLVEQEVKNDN